MTRFRSLFIRRIGLVVVLGSTLSVSATTSARTVYTPSQTEDTMYTLSVGGDGALGGLGSFSLASQPTAVTIAPDGQHVYVARAGSDAISVYAVQFAGSLQYQTAIATGTTPVALALTPSGSALFSADAGGQISGFTVGSDGSLSAPQGAGAQLAGTSPDGLAVSPGGNYLFAADSAGNKLKVFAVGAGAQLSALNDADTGSAPAGIALTPDGSKLYVADALGATISGFGVSAAGGLTPIAGSPFSAGAGVRGLAITPDGSRLVAASDGAGTVASYIIGASGSLAAVANPSSLAGASAVAISADSTHAYVAGNGLVRAYDISPAGTLTQRGGDTITVGQHRGIAVTPDQAPIAAIDSALGYPGNASKFEGGHSFDPDGSIATWEWDFGDGAHATGSHLDHVYAKAGTYRLTLTVTDDQGCSVTPKFTGQILLCNGGASAQLVQSVTITDPPVLPAPDPPCIHDGNDGFCGTPDLKAPQVIVAGITNGASISTVDAPDQIAGFITPDPSGIKSVMLRFTKAAGFKTITKKAKRTCRTVRVRGKKKRKCKTSKKRKLVTKIALCDTIAVGKNYLVRKQCSNVGYLSISGDATFRYDLPVALGTGSYTIDALAVDGAGNTDVVEPGRNQISFKVVKTPSNSGDGGGTTTPTSPTGPSAPIDDTGSPFG